MKAVALMQQRIVVASDAFVEIVIWRVPAPVPPSDHEFKYRLAYVVGERCVLRYDNERGKGDHRHRDGVETAYAFETPERLMADFLADVERWNHEYGRA